MKLKLHPRNLAFALFASALLAISGCAGQKNAANAAVNAAQASLASIRDEAAKYMPGELESVESSLTALKEKLAQGEYKQVVADAPALNSSIDSLKSGVAAKAEAAKTATAEWANYATAVPQMVSALQSRVDILAKSKRYPKGLDATSFAAVQTDFEAMKADWNAAMSASTSGNPIDAVAGAKSAQATGQRLLQQLGMTPAGA